MHRYILFLLAFSLMIFIGCDSGADEEAGFGGIVIQAFDAPFEGNVEHIYLNVIEVSVHKSGSGSDSDTSAQWLILSEADTTIDFLELVNGQMATLIQTELEVGQYSQLRILLGDSSNIVVDSTAYELKVPSGSQSGIKLNLNFSIEPDEIIEIYLDFDAALSISKHPNQDRYSMRPTFRVFKSVLSGTISGTIADTSGIGIEDVSVYSVAGSDSLATLTSESGEYKFILLSGTYNISAAGYNLSSYTTYQAIVLNAGDELVGYDFIME